MLQAFILLHVADVWTLHTERDIMKYVISIDPEGLHATQIEC